MTNKYAVPALEKGLDILELLAEQETALSQAEIAAQLGRSGNEIYRVLVGLEARGYLHRESESGKYVMSLKLYTLARRISPLDRIRRRALPLMEDFAFTHGQSCYLSMLYQSQVMVIVNANNHGPISLTVAEGTLSSPSISATGKVLLAHSKPLVRDMILDRDEPYKKQTAKQQQSLISELNTIKDTKVCTAMSSLLPGLTEVATPIGKPGGQIIAALCVPFLPTLERTQPCEQLADALKLTAQRIEAHIN